MEILEYGVSLSDQLSGPANQASKSLGGLTSFASKAKSGLNELVGSFVRVVAPAEVVKGAFEGIGAGVSAMANGFRSGDIKEVISGFTESLAGLATMLDLVYPGLGQLASAAIKVGGAFTAATVGIVQAGTELAIEATMGKRAMLDMFGALAGGAKEGAEVEEMLGGLSEQIGLTKDEMAPLAKSFMAMGITGTDALKKITTAALSAQAILGDPAAAHAFESLTKKIQVAVQTGQGLKIPAKGLGSLAEMGLRVDDVAKRMNVSTASLSDQLKNGTVNATQFGDALQDALIEKGAGPLSRMGASFAAMKKMFGQSVEDMFEDMGSAVDPFMAQVKDLLSIFSQSTESGKAMKSGITGAFSYILEVATSAILPIKHFFLDLVIWSLKGYILIKQHWSDVKTVMIGLAGILGVVAAAAALMLIPMAIGTATVIALGAGIGWLIGKLGELAPMAIDFGANVVKGFVNGILSGISWVTDAVGSIAGAAKDGLKNFLGINSPSKVGFELGGFFPVGVAGGIEGGVGDVTAASKEVGSAVVVGASAGMRSSDYSVPKGGGEEKKSGTKGTAIQIGDVTIQLTAPNGVTDASRLVETAVAALFERLALSQGLGV